MHSISKGRQYTIKLLTHKIVLASKPQNFKPSKLTTHKVAHNIAKYILISLLGYDCIKFHSIIKCICIYNLSASGDALVLITHSTLEIPFRNS